MPRVFPVICQPRSAAARGTVHSPVLIRSCASNALRLAPSSNNMAMSAVASVTSAGVYPIAIFRSAAACISIWSTPTEYVEITLTEGETRLKKSASSLSNGVIRIASAPSAAVRSSSRVKDAPSPLRRTSYWLLIRVSTGLMKCDDTNNTGFFMNCVLPKACCSHLLRHMEYCKHPPNRKREQRLAHGGYEQSQPKR